MRIIQRLIFLAPLLVACQSPTAATTMDGQTLAQRVQSTGLPVADVQVFTTDTDPNKLLGRPNQYITKVSWFDTRIPERDTLSVATIEGFASAADLKSRQDYTEAISKSAGAFAQYIYRNDKRLLLMRLPHELTPEQAQQYRAWLDAL